VTALYKAGRGVPAGRLAVIAGGLSGADKDAALTGADVNRTQYLTVSIDRVLVAMAARKLIPVSDQSPLAAADVHHGEAQYLAKRIALLALADGRNLILEISLASRRAAESWMYAMRFAGYTVNTVFADIAIEEAIRRSDEACRRGEEEYRQGRGFGGRRIPADAIRALAGPAAADARNRVRWASGARGTGIPSEVSATMALPGGAVTAMLAAYRAGERTLDDLGLEFRARRWPAVPDVCPPDLEPARAALDDPEPYVPGSVDDVVLAYDRGEISAADFEFLIAAIG
jgi:hypothetical protein